MLLGTGADAFDEVARWLSPTQQTVPTFLGRTPSILFVGSAGQLGWCAMPVGLANLGEERFDHFDPRLRGQKWRRGLPSPLQRRDDDLVERLVAQNLTDSVRLHEAQLGERRIDHVEAIANPFGLAVADENDVHDLDDGSGGSVAEVEPPNAPVAGTSGAEAGWYPDPMRRFEFRYYNGLRWTADVAQHSNRYVDPIGSTPPMFTATSLSRAPSRAMAVTALVFSLCSVAVAWVPFLFVVGAAGAIVAIVLAIIVLRRSARNTAAGQPVAIGQELAIGALVTSVAALALCFVGVQLTRLVLREVDQLVNPGPHVVQIDRCEREDGRVVAEGSIRNDDNETHGYTITITFRLDGERWETDSVGLTDVGAGERADFATTSDSVSFSAAAVTCTIDDVYGPAPFTD